MRVQHLLAAVVIVLGLATGAAAQAKAIGTVRDLAGKAIKGATVKAVNPDASPSEFASATDDKGRAAIEWGVYGMPETFVLNGKGEIVFKHVGPVTPQSMEQKLMPAIARAQAGPPSPAAKAD